MREVVRGVIREEARSALADHRAEEHEREATKLVPLTAAAARLGLSPKALRSRCERGSVSGAKRIGGRWHLPLISLLPAQNSISRALAGADSPPVRKR